MHRLFPVTLTGALLLGCTHDFDQFAPVAGSGATVGTTSGAGGGTTTSGTGGASTTTSGSGGTAAGGSGGQGTGGTATGGGGGQGTGGAAPDAGVENCTNGKDDDGDGKADCADPKCGAGFTCAPTAPDGWSGPGWLYDGATAGAPTCAGAPGDKQYEGHRDMVAGPALCGACSCEVKGTCELGPLTAYGSPGCAGGSAEVVQGPAGQCRDLNAEGASFKAAAPTPKSASCTPGKGAISRPAPTWDTTGVVCGLAPSAAAGCDPGTLCAARPFAPFGATLCVWKAGDAACPVAFPEKHAFWDGATDNRDCTACECGADSAKCTATTSLHPNSCNQPAAAVVPNDGSCVAASNPGRMKVEVTLSATCLGGQPVGSVVEGPSATTVCCAK